LSALWSGHFKKGVLKQNMKETSNPYFAKF